MWDYKDHLSETVWVSLRPITAFSAVACVQSLINVKKYWKKLYHFVCRRRREIIYHRTKLNNNYANTWTWHYTIMRKTIKNCAFWHLMSVGSGMQWNAGEMPVLLQTEWCFCIYIQMLPIEQLRVYLLVNNHWKMMFWSFCSATVVPEVGLKLSSVCAFECVTYRRTGDITVKYSRIYRKLFYFGAGIFCLLRTLSLLLPEEILNTWVRTKT